LLGRYAENYTKAGNGGRLHGLRTARCAHWQVQQQPERGMKTLIGTAENNDIYNEFDKDDFRKENEGPVNGLAIAIN